MKIGIGSDHRGFELKEELKKHFSKITWVDVGTENGNDRVDYPVYVKKVCDAVLDGSVDRGVLICGSGVGVTIAANRFKKIYAALCCSPDMAAVARQHDCANVLALSSDFITKELSFQIVTSWLKEDFLGGRYEKRLQMLD